MAQKGSTVAVAAVAIVDQLNVLHEIEIDMFAGPGSNSTDERSYRTDYSFVVLIFMSIMATDICLMNLLRR